MKALIKSALLGKYTILVPIDTLVMCRRCAGTWLGTLSEGLSAVVS